MRRQKHATIAKKSSNINTLLLKTIAKFGTITIILVNKEVLCLAYAFQNVVYQKKLL